MACEAEVLGFVNDKISYLSIRGSEAKPKDMAPRIGTETLNPDLPSCIYCTFVSSRLDCRLRGRLAWSITCDVLVVLMKERILRGYSRHVPSFYAVVVCNRGGEHLLITSCVVRDLTVLADNTILQAPHTSLEVRSGARRPRDGPRARRASSLIPLCVAQVQACSCLDCHKQPSSAGPM
jgi:hypothetical protein